MDDVEVEARSRKNLWNNTTDLTSSHYQKDDHLYVLLLKYSTKNKYAHVRKRRIDHRGVHYIMKKGNRFRYQKWKKIILAITVTPLKIKYYMLVSGSQIVYIYIGRPQNGPVRKAICAT